jgi:hypothetical protein
MASAAGYVGAGPSAESRFERNVPYQSGVRWGIFSDDPINDLGSKATMPTSAALIEGYRQIIAKAHARRIRFLCSTLTPFEGSNGWKPAGKSARREVNALLVDGKSGCDAIVDQDAATHDPALPRKFPSAYDGGDHHSSE